MSDIDSSLTNMATSSATTSTMPPVLAESVLNFPTKTLFDADDLFGRCIDHIKKILEDVISHGGTELRSTVDQAAARLLQLLNEAKMIYEQELNKTMNAIDAELRSACNMWLRMANDIVTRSEKAALSVLKELENTIALLPGSKSYIARVDSISPNSVCKENHPNQTHITFIVKGRFECASRKNCKPHIEFNNVVYDCHVNSISELSFELPVELFEPTATLKTIYPTLILPYEYNKWFDPLNWFTVHTQSKYDLMITVMPKSIGHVRVTKVIKKHSENVRMNDSHKREIIGERGFHQQFGQALPSQGFSVKLDGQRFIRWLHRTERTGASITFARLDCVGYEYSQERGNGEFLVCFEEEQIIEERITSITEELPWGQNLVFPVNANEQILKIEFSPFNKTYHAFVPETRTERWFEMVYNRDGSVSLKTRDENEILFG